MKEYDRKQKKWVNEDVNRKLKKRELCKGGREHDFVLVLPDYVTYTNEYQHRPQEYYAILDEMEAFKQEAEERIRRMGVISRYSSFSKHRLTRMYMCSVCKKKHYEFPD